MKMSSFPLPVGAFPNLATAQLLMSAAGGMNLPPPPGASSPKDLPNMSPSAIASLSGVRLPGMPEGLVMGGGHPAMYGLPPHLANIPPGMIDPRFFLPAALSGGYDMKDNADAFLAWRQIAAQAQAASAGVISYDAHAAAMAAAASLSYPSYSSMDLNGARRKNATRETTSTLKAWLYEHRKNPYPTKGEKIMLAIITKMTLTQVSTWFANARRRLKKENKMTWSPRNRTDDGSSIDDEDKPDNEDGLVGDDDDDVSIDLSDFETESNSPQKPSSALIPTNSQQKIPVSAVPTQSLATSPNTNIGNNSSSSSSSKPRIWSIADVAASKPPTASHVGPMHHQHSSVRHRPYSIPNTTAFRPFLDNSYRQMTGHPALAAIAPLGNPLFAGRPTIANSSLRPQHLSSGSSNSSLSSSHSIRSPVPNVSSIPASNTIDIINSMDSRTQMRDRVSPPQSNDSKREIEQ